MMQTTCRLDGNHWVINGRKKFITGADGARVGIVMARSDDGACMFLVDLPDPAIRTVRVIDTIDSSMPGGHAEVDIVGPARRRTRCWARAVKALPMRKSASAPPGCLIACAGSGLRCAHEIATDYACRRHAFGKPLVDHEMAGLMLAWPFIIQSRWN